MKRTEVWLNDKQKRFLEEFTHIRNISTSEAIRIMIDYYVKEERRKEIKNYGKGKTD